MFLPNLKLLEMFLAGLNCATLFFLLDLTLPEHHTSQVPQPTCFWKWLLKSGGDPVYIRPDIFWSFMFMAKAASKTKYHNQSGEIFGIVKVVEINLQDDCLSLQKEYSGQSSSWGFKGWKVSFVEIHHFILPHLLHIKGVLAPQKARHHKKVVVLWWEKLNSEFKVN